MPRMIKRWLRRRLAPQEEVAESPMDDRPLRRGVLVRKGKLVTLRTHIAANREAFQCWYADPEIASLLRHDLEPLSASQSRSYFDTFILPASARGVCFAIHERGTKRLIGTTALTDRRRDKSGDSALFRVVIGEKDVWGRGYGTEATSLVAQHAFEALGLDAVRLEVFSHNARALGAYERVGFIVTGEHTEWVSRRKVELHVIEMRLDRENFRPVSSTRDRKATADDANEPVDRLNERADARAARRMRRAQKRSNSRRQAETDAAATGDSSDYRAADRD
jgi:RimJ/RimL family protein N-acetyltransferase